MPSIYTFPPPPPPSSLHLHSPPNPAFLTSQPHFSPPASSSSRSSLALLAIASWGAVGRREEEEEEARAFCCSFSAGSYSSFSSCSCQQAARLREAACSRSRSGRWKEVHPTTSSGSCRGGRRRRPARPGSTTPSASRASGRSSREVKVKQHRLPASLKAGAYISIRKRKKRGCIYRIEAGQDEIYVSITCIYMGLH